MKAVAERLGDAACLFLDDWADDPADIAVWARERPLDLNRWPTPEFSAALATLRAGGPVEMPRLSQSVGLDRHRTTPPAAYVVVEEPFGYLRDETADSIGLAVLVDVPPQVALARRLQR